MTDDDYKNLSSGVFWLYLPERQNSVNTMLQLVRLYINKYYYDYFNYPDALLWYGKISEQFSDSVNAQEKAIAKVAGLEVEHFLHYNFWLEYYSIPSTWSDDSMFNG